MVKRSLIAIAVVALLATSAQALGPDPHTGLIDGTHQSIKINIQNMDIGWPVEYKALDLCVIPVYMHVGYFVDVAECIIAIKLVQVGCGDIEKGVGDWPCYLDCKTVLIRANFKVKLGLRLEKNRAGEDIIGEWDAYFGRSDVIAGDGSWHTKRVCVKAWKARLQNHPAGEQVRVGKVTLTVKPNV